MGILQNNKAERDDKVIDFTLANSNNLLLIFTRNPELGKGKRRLAATVGDEAALDIYKFLLGHTVAITKNLYAEKEVYYSEEIWENDIWDNQKFGKKLQVGEDLGIRMANAFQEGFQNEYQKIIIIGSDMLDLSQEDLENAFKSLEKNDFVVGPAEDGGYYLLGMKKFMPALFKNKTWGTETVLKDTLADLKNETTALLETKNDVDYYEDIKDIEAFEPFLKHIKL
ncbi:TIGR04282 family arsenosugar biosynthesis glycosyltransferase [Maribacter stanieri]|uniref:TIGR04282 family arsenosugar biosynthesis glycosyltransferase n=1 Tax=Maribacter stanieri TaxID=440514 RepID=UPI003CD0DBB2